MAWFRPFLEGDILSPRALGNKQISLWMDCLSQYRITRKPGWPPEVENLLYCPSPGWIIVPEKACWLTGTGPPDTPLMNVGKDDDFYRMLTQQLSPILLKTVPLKPDTLFGMLEGIVNNWTDLLEAQVYDHQGGSFASVWLTETADQDTASKFVQGAYWLKRGWGPSGLRFSSVLSKIVCEESLDQIEKVGPLAETVFGGVASTVENWTVEVERGKGS